MPDLGGNLQDTVAEGYTSTGSVIYVIIQHLYRLGYLISSNFIVSTDKTLRHLWTKSTPGKEPAMLLFGEMSLQTVKILAVMYSGGVRWVNNSITISVNHSLHF